MRLILDDCFVCDEAEPGLLTASMQPSCLRLTNSTSTFSQLWKASGKAAERRNSFLRCEVFTLASLIHGLTLRGIQLLGKSDACRALQCFCWSASESAHSREAVKILLNRQQESRELLVIKCDSVGPFLGKLWNTPCLECIQNTVWDITNKPNIIFNGHQNPLFQESVTCSPCNIAVKSTQCPAKCTCEFPPLSCQWEDPVPAWWLDVLAHQFSGFTRENNLPLKLEKLSFQN